jgi:hypothetical protein
MSVAQIRGVALYKRNKWRKEFDENKVDMGMIDPFSQEVLDYSLYTAVIENSISGMREMVAMGADANMWLDGKAGEPAGSLLHFAVRHASLKTVISLLQLGADPLVRDAVNATPRDVAQGKLSAGRLRTVLKQWEQRSNSAAGDMQEVIAFDTLMKAAS